MKPEQSAFPDWILFLYLHANFAMVKAICTRLGEQDGLLFPSKTRRTYVIH